MSQLLSGTGPSWCASNKGEMHGKAHVCQGVLSRKRKGNEVKPQWQQQEHTKGVPKESLGTSHNSCIAGSHDKGADPCLTGRVVGRPIAVWFVRS